MSSDSIQIGGPAGTNNNSFTQNGQVDWVAFGRSVWNVSSAVLQRFASAGVQPITFGAGLALASGFNLDRVGKQRIHGALEKAQGKWSFDKVLEFGFGVRSFLHVMADAQSGVNCIALCSALGEVHHVHAAAWVLDELWKTYGYPQQFLPSHSQFIALIKACSGVLTRTEYSSITDRMLGHTLDPQLHPFIADSEDIAKAMSGLFKISKGEIARITVVGGVECAFVASFAHWVLNLKVYVDDAAGTVLYQDAGLEEVQVVVTYGQQSDNALLQISSTTYVLREADEMMFRTPKMEENLFYLKTPWDGCLARVFGIAFSSLVKAPIILGGYLGSAARVYQALALGESDVGNFSRERYINFVEPSYGIGFINSVITIFPELNRVSGLFDEMQMALNAPLREAFRTTERTVLDLQQLCQCSGCTPGEPENRIGCIVALAFSIRDMVSTISCVTRDDDLLPTIRGINFVRLRAELCLQWHRLSRWPLLPLALGLYAESNLGIEASEAYEDYVEQFEKPDLLSHPMEIFSGYSNHSRYSRKTRDPIGLDICAATVSQGLCYFLSSLRSLSTLAENARVVHIIPGHIQMGDRQFSSVYDKSGGSTLLSPIQYEVFEESGNANMIQQPRQLDIKLELMGLTKSTDHELAIYYRATVPGESAVTINPARITYRVLKHSGLLTCERLHCTSRLILPCAMIRQGWSYSDRDNTKTWIGSRTGHVCVFWPQLDDVARCLAIQCATSTSANTYLVLRRDECISCCTVSLVRGRSRKGGRNEIYQIL